MSDNPYKDFMVATAGLANAKPTGIYFLCDEDGNCPALDYLREEATKEEQLRQVVFNMIKKESKDNG